MAYIISEDAQELLKDVHEFCENEVKEQAREYDITGEWPREIYEKAIEMQLHMMDVPEEYGGLGLDHMDQAAIVEEIAKADAGVAVTLNGNGLALKPVLIAGTEEQKRKCSDIIVKASGNGGFRMMVFAPSTVQEAVDMTYQAFDYADRDRNPVLILADGVIGTMMEPVVLPEMKSEEEVSAIKDSKRKWACVGHPLDYKNRAWIEPGQWSTVIQQQKNEEAAALYESWEKDVQVEEYRTEDAEVVIAAYGISARIAKSAVELLRKEGKKVGLIRPITVSPFPYQAFDRLNYANLKGILDVEMSIPAQFVEDVKAGVKERCPIHTCLCSGGNIMSREKVIEAVNSILEG